MIENRKSRRRAAALGMPVPVKPRPRPTIELDQAEIARAFPRSILVYEADGSQTQVGTGPVAGIMSRTTFERLALADAQ